MRLPDVYGKTDIYYTDYSKWEALNNLVKISTKFTDGIIDEFRLLFDALFVHDK